MAETRRTLEQLPEHPTPDIDPEAHVLQVDGRVLSPHAYGVTELRALADAVHVEDFDCLEGWVVPDQRWEGVPLATVLDVAVPQPGVSHVAIGYQGFSIVLPVAEARRSLLALSLNGAPLTISHGGPVRLVVPGGECFTSIKWVDHITACTENDGIDGTARGIAMRRIGLDPGD